jgi:hypothetical protein
MYPHKLPIGPLNRDTYRIAEKDAFGGEGTRIAILDAWPEDVEADARLMTTAPEMLQTLEFALKYITEENANIPRHSVVIALRSTIRAAKGTP